MYNYVLKKYVCILMYKYIYILKNNYNIIYIYILYIYNVLIECVCAG